jgi:hypothetical protein
MGLFGKQQKQPTLPGNIISLMERFGRYEFNPQTSGIAPADMGQLMAELYPFASADPDGFLATLAGAVLPVGGWAVYGASRAIWELLSPSTSVSIRQHPSYKAIMNAALEFLRSMGVPPMRLRGYERDYWLASGGTMDTWLPRLPTAPQVQAKPNTVPSSPEAWVQAGIAHLQNGRFAEAVAACDSTLPMRRPTPTKVKPLPS